MCTIFLYGIGFVGYFRAGKLNQEQGKEIARAYEFALGKIRDSQAALDTERSEVRLNGFIDVDDEAQDLDPLSQQRFENSSQKIDPIMIEED